MKHLKVIYTGGLDPKLDKKITKFFEKLSWRWMGQGMSIKSQIRDISFEESNKTISHN